MKCDGNCNDCLPGNNMHRVAYFILAKYNLKDPTVYGHVQEICPNLTCCPECCADDFCHVDGCSIEKEINTKKEVEEKGVLVRVEEKMDNIIKLLNPIVKIDKELRADIQKALSHGKAPRKQPVDVRAWKTKGICDFCENALKCDEEKMKLNINEDCKNWKKDLLIKKREKVAQDG